MIVYGNGSLCYYVVDQYLISNSHYDYGIKRNYLLYNRLLSKKQYETNMELALWFSLSREVSFAYNRWNECVEESSLELVMGRP